MHNNMRLSQDFMDRERKSCTRLVKSNRDREFQRRFQDNHRLMQQFINKEPIDDQLGLQDLIIERNHNYSIMPLNQKGQQKVEKFIQHKRSGVGSQQRMQEGVRAPSSGREVT
jgi:hypothetical protein